MPAIQRLAAALLIIGASAALAHYPSMVEVPAGDFVMGRDDGPLDCATARNGTTTAVADATTTGSSGHASLGILILDIVAIDRRPSHTANDHHTVDNIGACNCIEYPTRQRCCARCDGQALL